MKKIAILMALLFLSACSSNADLVKALASDPATVKIDITSPFGSFHLDRSNPTSAQVPVQIVPMPAGTPAAAVPAK